MVEIDQITDAGGRRAHHIYASSICLSEPTRLLFQALCGNVSTQRLGDVYNVRFAQRRLHQEHQERSLAAY